MRIPHMILYAAAFGLVCLGLLGCAASHPRLHEPQSPTSNSQEGITVQSANDEKPALMLWRTPQASELAAVRPKNLALAPHAATRGDSATEAGNLVFWLIFIFGVLILAGAH